MIRQVINGRDADVLQTETIVGEYAIAPIGDISKRVGARSIQFKLPKTANNKAIFESSEIPTSTSKIPYRNLPCRIYVDGVDMNMQFCILESVDENYNIRMYGGNSVLFDTLKNKKLADLDLRHLNHHWDVDHIAVSKAKDYPLKYALVDYNEDSPNFSINETDSKIWMGCLLPVVYEHYLIEKCVNEAGYSLNNETASSIMFAENTPVIPLSSGDHIRDEDYSRYCAKFNMDTLYAGNSLFGNWWNVFDIISQREQYWVNGVKDNLPKGLLTKSSHFKMPDECKVKVRLIFNYSANPSSTNIPFNAVISFVPTSTPIIGSGTFGVQFNLLVDNTVKLFDETVDLDCFYPTIPGLARFHLCGFTIWVEKSDAFSVTNIIDATDATLEILECTKVSDHERKIEYLPFVDGFEVSKVSGYTTIANNLPDFTQAEFLKQYMLRTNSICSIDERNKILSIVPYKKLKDNIGLSVDWSGKLDFTNKPKTEFKLDYSQSNHLKYKDDSSIVKPIGTDKVFTIDDKTLDLDKVLIQLQYTATESAYRVNRDIAQIKSFKSLAFEKPSTPRCLLLRFEDFAFEYVGNGTGGITGVNLTTDIPIGFFIDSTQTYSNGFGNDLFNQFFLFIIGVIDYAKLIECEVRLNALDIANFEPLKPVYIREFDAHFYVNKIKFEYTSRKSSVVELIKLL